MTEAGLRTFAISDNLFSHKKFTVDISVDNSKEHVVRQVGVQLCNFLTLHDMWLLKQKFLVSLAAGDYHIDHEWNDIVDGGSNTVFYICNHVHSSPPSSSS